MSGYYAQCAVCGDTILKEDRYCRSHVDLRDRFAMAALTGLISDPDREYNPEEFADVAYRYADAMLAARGAR